MNIEEAIDYIEKYINIIDNTETKKALKIILKEFYNLKSDNLNWKGEYHLLSRKIIPDTINKNDIKKRIEELEKIRNTMVYPLKEQYNIKILAYKELLEEDKQCQN